MSEKKSLLSRGHFLQFRPRTSDQAEELLPATAPNYRQLRSTRSENRTRQVDSTNHQRTENPISQNYGQERSTRTENRIRQVDSTNNQRTENRISQNYRQVRSTRAENRIRQVHSTNSQRTENPISQNYRQVRSTRAENRIRQDPFEREPEHHYLTCLEIHDRYKEQNNPPNRDNQRRRGRGRGRERGGGRQGAVRIRYPTPEKTEEPCTNCGAATHTSDLCFGRPRWKGAKWSNRNIAPDDLIIPPPGPGYAAKRDPWYKFFATEGRGAP